MSDRERSERGYRALRESVAAYPLPRDVVALSGPEAASYLQGQLTQDISDLAVGASADTLVLAPDGKIDALARVTRSGEELFHLDVDGGNGEALLARLARFKLRSRFDLEALDWTCVALRGSAVPDRSVVRAPVVAAVDWHGWGGLDLLGPTGEVEFPEQVEACSEAAWEAARIESGVPVMGREITPGVIPAEAGVVGRTVSFTKGCFTGQELVARIDSRGASVPHHLAGLVFDAEVDPGCLTGAALFTPERDRAAGRVTSAAFCFGLATTGALCYVHRSVSVPARVEVVPEGAARADGYRGEIRELPLA